MTRAKSKKAVPDICPEIFNKISIKRALFVVEATRQNILEAFLLLTTSSFLAGFSPVKVPSKRYTWISPSVVSTPVNKLVFLSIASTFGAASTSSSKKMVKKTKSSEKWGQLLAFAIVTLNPFVVSNEILDEISIVLSGMFKSSLVLKAKQFSPVESPIKLAHVKTVFQLVHGFLVSLEAAFLVELTSSVHLATFKIAKSLVISEFGSPSAAVVLHDVLLDVSAANIKMALSVFGNVTRVVLKSTGVWQYVVVYFEKLDSAISALNY
ncbi:hypothetical protein G9A89_021499 [Geosiphon pyriformis]|nr:hypothetical protein G9A89_021499 [Geosiphon pyriformis]